MAISVRPRAIPASRRAAPPIPELDGLRGVAILLVFLTHFIALYLVGTVGLDARVHAIARIGWTGVDLFFVLSGFLITGILLDTKGRAHYWRNYAAKRCLRIFPLYFGVLFVAFVIVPFLHWDEPQYATLRENQVWYWTYLVNVLQVVKGPESTPLNTSHLWSLCIEEQFYLVWPLVVWFLTPRRLLHVALAVIGVGLVFRVAVVAGPGPLAAYVLTPGRLDGLMVGAMLAVVARGAGGLTPWRTRANQVFVGAVALLFGLSLWRGMDYRDPVVAVVGYPLLALGYGALLVLTLTVRGRWARWMRTPSLRRWGKYSYGLYLFHFPLLWGLDSVLSGVFHYPFLSSTGSRLPAVMLRALIGVPLAFGIAWLSYELYERRFLALKRRFT